MTDDHYDDPTDTVDIDGKLWGEERTIRQQEHEALRVLDDGRTVAPMTLDDMIAERRAAREDEAERFGHLDRVRPDWTHGDRWGAA